MSVNLTQVADIINESVCKYEGAKSYIATGDVDCDHIDSATDVSFLGKPSRANLTAKHGDVIVARMKGTIKVLEIDGALSNKIYSTGFAVLRPKPNKITSALLKHFLLSDTFQRQKNKYATGATQKAASNSGLGKVTIKNLPESLDEQKYIAKILDRADEVRKKRQQAIDTLDELLRATFLDMFGDPVLNPKGWDVKPLKKIITSIDSGKSPRCLDRRASKEEYGILKLSAVSSYKFRKDENKAVFNDFKIDQRHLIKNGDLLFSRKNTYDLVGAVALINDEVNNLLMPDLIFRLNIMPESETTAPFLWCLLSLPHIRHEIKKIASGAAGSMPNISKARLFDLKLISPKKDIQKEFEEFYHKIIKLKKKKEQALINDNNLFNALTQRAFKGEL